jgi:hypothetical protein
MAMPLWSNGIRELLTKLGLKMLVDWFNDFANWVNSNSGGDIIYTSPNGTKYRLVVHNDGSIHSEVV